MHLNRIAPILLATAVSAAPPVRAGAAPPPPAFLSSAPENLARLTVRWEDPAKKEVFVIEGGRYQCRVGTWPARILSLRIDGRDLLGPAGLDFQVSAPNGRVYRPAPRGLVPLWKVWRGGAWRPARDGRARMNVWNAGIWYWEAHLLDIPLLPPGSAAALGTNSGKVLEGWTFKPGTADWEALHNCKIAATPEQTLRLQPTGDDPYVQSPAVNIPGPMVVEFRVRTKTPGGGVFYWSSTPKKGYRAEQAVSVDIPADGQWHTLRTILPVRGRLQRLRFDPPGSDGWTELAFVRLRSLPPIFEHGQIPLRGELVFHAFRDQLRIEFRCDPPDGAPPPVRFAWRTTDAEFAGMDSLAGRAVAYLGYAPNAAAILAPPGGSFEPERGEARAPLTGKRPGAWWVVQPLSPGRTAADFFRNDLAPLPDAAVQVRNGHWLGWDPAAGLYRISSIMDARAYGFSSAFDVPNRRMELEIALRSKRARTLMIQSRSNSAILPATVLTDPNGFMLPAPVQSCKNFSGEHEEPDDAGYGDAYFPVALRAGEERRFNVVHLFQRWGDHMLKQVTSIRFFHIYWHLSSGVSETTCFTIPHFMLHGVFVRIPDYRPYSGPFWVGQPQHSCLTWPGLLQYRSRNASVRLMYDETRFYSICPNLARFTMFFHTSDGAASARAEVMEIPQNDETRTFLRIRYRWNRPVSIDGDARLRFRWLNLDDKRTPEQLLWTDSDGTFQTRPVRADGKPMLLGVPLAPKFPVAGSDGIPAGANRRYSSMVLVRALRARLGGRAMKQPFLSAQYDKQYGNYWFCAPAERLQIEPGDFIEADLMLMPSGEPTQALLKPIRERKRWGSEGPVVEKVEIGRKIADFPATIAADHDVARCTLAGGHNALPLIVTGLSAPGAALLWENGMWMNPQCRGGDGVQVNPDGNGRYRWTFLIPLRHGMKPALTVTRAECSSRIRRLRDLNGFPCLEAERRGKFRLRAPMLFAPGRNEIHKDSPIVQFEGEASSVRGVPVLAVPDKGTVRVRVRHWSETRVDLSVDGPARIVFGQLAEGRPYRLRIGSRELRKTAGNRRISVHLDAAAPIVLERIVPDAG